MFNSCTKKTICKNILDNLEHFQDFKSSFQDVRSLKAKRRRRVHRDCRCKDTGPCTCNPDEHCALPLSFAQTKRKTSLLRTFLWARSPSAITRSATSTHAVQLSLTLVSVVIKICLPPTNQPTNQSKSILNSFKNLGFRKLRTVSGLSRFLQTRIRKSVHFAVESRIFWRIPGSKTRNLPG